MEHGRDTGDRRRRWSELDSEWLNYHVRDGSYVWYGNHGPNVGDFDQTGYIQEFYKATKGRQSKVFRPSKPRWKK